MNVPVWPSLFNDLDDGIVINCGVDAEDDHRIAMSFLIAGQFASVAIEVENCENIVTSFPDFLTICKGLCLSIS